MDLESTEPLPDTSKSFDSEKQDAKLAVSQSQPSSLLSPTSGSAGPNPMETTAASTSSHIESVAESGMLADEPDPMVQGHDRQDLHTEKATPEAGEGGQDISSSLSPNASVSGLEAEVSPLYSGNTSDQQQFSDRKDEDDENMEGETDSVEPSPSAIVVTSSESNSSPPSEPVGSRDVTSSNHQQALEASDEPQAKQRRLSKDYEPSSSPSMPNTQDLEPSSSSLDCPNGEANSTEQALQVMTANTPNISNAADTTASVTSYSLLPTKTALDSTSDNSLVLPSLEPSGVNEQTSSAEMGGGDGDMPQSVPPEGRIDLEGNSMKTYGDSSAGVGQDLKDQISSGITKGQQGPSENGSHEELMDQD